MFIIDNVSNIDSSALRSWSSERFRSELIGPAFRIDWMSIEPGLRWSYWMCSDVPDETRRVYSMRGFTGKDLDQIWCRFHSEDWPIRSIDREMISCGFNAEEILFFLRGRCFQHCARIPGGFKFPEFPKFKKHFKDNFNQKKKKSNHSFHHWFIYNVDLKWISEMLFRKES